MYIFVFQGGKCSIASGCTVKCGLWQSEKLANRNLSWMSTGCTVKCDPGLIEIFRYFMDSQ